MKCARAVVKLRIPILILTLILMVPAVFGMAATRVNYDMLTYLPEDMETVRGNVDEIHIGADRREGRIPAEGPSFPVYVDRFHIGHELDEMQGTRIQEPAAQHGLNPLHIN